MQDYQATIANYDREWIWHVCLTYLEALMLTVATWLQAARAFCSDCRALKARLGFIFMCVTQLCALCSRVKTCPRCSVRSSCWNHGRVTAVRPPGTLSMVGWKTRCLRTFGGGDGGAWCYGGHRNCIFAVNGGHYQKTLVGYCTTNNKQIWWLLHSLIYNALLSYYIPFIFIYNILCPCVDFSHDK